MRRKIVQGTSVLAVRSTIGFAVGFGGMLLLTRLIGAENYGLYVTISTIVSYMSDIALMGVSNYLIRKEGEVDLKLYDLAFTFALLASLIAIAVGFGASFLLSDWLNAPGIWLPFVIALVSLPAAAFLLPSQTIMERELSYKKIAFLEMHTQIIYYAVALSLAFLRFGIWAPVLANIAQGVAAIVIGCKYAKYRPSLHWAWGPLKEMLKYGASNSLSNRVWGLRPLVNPLIVGRFVGPEGVAVVSLALRLIQALSVVNGTIMRVSFSVLAKLQQDKQRMENALNEAMTMQIFSLAPFLIGFAALAHWIIPLLFDDSWNAILGIYPYLAFKYMIYGIFNLQMNVLYVYGMNWSVTKFNLLHVGVLAAATMLFVPAFGLYGYAWAEMAALFTYFAIHRAVGQSLKLDYRAPFFYTVLCVPAMFAPLVPFPWALLLLLPLVLFVALRKPRHQIADYAKLLLKRNKTVGAAS
ncbi:oligosaccharide flippase family protein [Paenibacillaceae bacterium WGS1546]|uniref:oligosaccharide flippase family protein n=1 Tax=Cohnella sp. WGS1546 TaxID=3366810 RepID=UPI00372D769F